ncbi:MAG: hypothetical protein JWN85_4163 [Gammaproteobacteria bacterium]|nr:hypothetical protein [Gammaproteobacteria bacterium]
MPTRALILNEVERLIASKGVYGFTLRDVAEPLGVQVPAIYKHYADRDDVLVEVARRFVDALSGQFALPEGDLWEPRAVLSRALDEFVDFHVGHPAYVRLSLIDFATPEGGMEYVTLATGGPFRDSVRSGPLAPMYQRVSTLMQAGWRTGDFRRVVPLDFYRLVKASLLFHLVFPDDSLLTSRSTPTQVAHVKAGLRDVAVRYLRPEGSHADTRGTGGRTRAKLERPKRR